MNSSPFDWHAGRITRDTPVTATYRNTQNVRRFLRSQCGPSFRFDRPFMAWIKDGTAKTMGEVADEWRRRNPGRKDPREAGASEDEAVFDENLKRLATAKPKATTKINSERA